MIQVARGGETRAGRCRLAHRGESLSSSLVYKIYVNRERNLTEVWIQVLLEKLDLIFNSSWPEENSDRKKNPMKKSFMRVTELIRLSGWRWISGGDHVTSSSVFIRNALTCEALKLYISAEAILEVYHNLFVT